MPPAAGQAAGNIQLVKLPLPGRKGIPDLPSTVEPWGWLILVEQVSLYASVA